MLEVCFLLIQHIIFLICYCLDILKNICFRLSSVSSMEMKSKNKVKSCKFRMGLYNKVRNIRDPVCNVLNDSHWLT